jgi:outer membrane protein assembly factor BamB
MKRVTLTCLLASFLLSGCAGFNWFQEDHKTVLKGERVSVLQFQKDLVPDPALQNLPVTIPDAWTNQFWPQAGGYPNHVMGNLALAANLKEAWSASIGAGGSRRDPLTAEPVVAEGLIFTLDTDGVITAFDVSNGKQKWRQETAQGEKDSGCLGGGLAYASGKLYITNGCKTLVALNPATGAMTWKTDLRAPARSAPTVADDKVYVITLDNHLLVFSAADGTPLWNYAGVAEETNLLGSASPAADKGLVILPLSSGELLALRPENGQVVWEDNLSAVRRLGALSSIADIRGLPVIDQGVVFAVSYSGRFVALDVISGRRLWQREIGGAETPLPAGDHVFSITTDQQLAAFTRQGGVIHWTMQLPRYLGDDKDKPVVWTGPVLAGGRLVVASSGGEMLEMDPKDGRILRKRSLSGNVTIPPIVAANTLFILAESGKLTAYR